MVKRKEALYDYRDTSVPSSSTDRYGDMDDSKQNNGN